MKIVSVKIIAMLLLAANIVACGGGGSDSSNAGNPSSGSPATGAVNINAQKTMQYATPKVATAQQASNAANPCLGVQMGTISNGAWWLSGSFNITNTCSTTQSIDGTQVALASPSGTLNASSFTINTTTPWVANFATVTGMGNAILLTVNSGIVNANNSKPFMLAANGGTLNVSFGYDPGGKLLSGGITATLNGGTPVTPATLAVDVDSTGLASYCTTASPCNIPVILSGQSGQYSLTLTTVTSATSNTTFNVTGLNPGIYTLSTGTLPATVLATYSATSVTLKGGDSGNLSLLLALKPATTGVLNFTITNPQPTLFSQQTLPVTLQPAGSGSPVSVQAALGQANSVTLTAGSYTLSAANGFASASQGVFDTLQPATASVTVNGTSTVNPTWATTKNLISQPIIVNGLNSGDSATLVFTDTTYAYNQEVVTATAASQSIQTVYQFPAGDVVTVNVKTNTSYQTVAPFTITIPSAASGQPSTINLVAKTQPTQQIVGYFETWMAQGTWEASTYSISGVPPYVGIIPLAFAKPDSTYVAGSLNFAAAGLGISATPSVALGAIQLAQAKGQKLLLSVGGATYPNFAAFNLKATLALVQDLGLDGVDLDYEATSSGCSNLNTKAISCPTDAQMISIINQLRTGLNTLSTTLNKRMYLTAAVWSIGAYGSTSFPTTQNGPVGDFSGLWVNPLTQVGTAFDALFLMAYDAGNVSNTGYNPISALQAYQALYKGPIYLGIEVPPEAWGGNVSSPAQDLAEETQAMQLGAAGTMIWALQVQSTNTVLGPVNASSYLTPICNLYNLPDCSLPIPLN